MRLQALGFQKQVSDNGEDRLDLLYSKAQGPPSRVILKPLLSPVLPFLLATAGLRGSTAQPLVDFFYWNNC